MNANNSRHAIEHPQSKPYCIVGAGPLSAALWKTGNESYGWEYQFNVFSLHSTDGTVTQTFSPSDVVNLAKLAHVLAAVLVDDGCLTPEVRAELALLRDALEGIFCHTGE